jgi:hypothetical protein
MAMSISSAQVMLQVATAASAAPAGRSTQAAAPAVPSASVPTATPAVESPPEFPAPAPAVMSPGQFSTDREVDSQHQIYYKFVDDRTGDVVFEIPPAALREIGESLNLPLEGDESAHAFDVKS